MEAALKVRQGKWRRKNGDRMARKGKGLDGMIWNGMATIGNGRSQEAKERQRM